MIGVKVRFNIPDRCGKECRMLNYKTWPSFSLAVFLGGCAMLQPHHQAEQLAQSAGLQKSAINTGGFVLTAYSRLEDLDQPVNVYIEGDGLAWLSRHQLSADPTPHEAIGLGLAVEDPAKNVVYLARPCQFNNFDLTPCDSAYWSNKRFSQEVIEAMSFELSAYMRKMHNRKINLIGYSGGAAVAALLAARRNDVVSLRTVAGNLDHNFVNHYHEVDATPESLNAIDIAEKIKALPQLHFVGISDEVIPKQVALRFIARQQSQSSTAPCTGIIMVAAGHQENWLQQWPELLRQPLPC
jgi:predicted esterase